MKNLGIDLLCYLFYCELKSKDERLFVWNIMTIFRICGKTMTNGPNKNNTGMKTKSKQVLWRLEIVTFVKLIKPNIVDSQVAS